MKRPSKQVRSNLLNALLIVGTIAIVIYLGARNGDIGSSFDAILQADFRWFAAATGVWAISVICEALINQSFFVQQKVNVRFSTTMHVTLLGMFYSNVTPAATGGQPMQVYAFKKRGVPTGVSSSALAVKFFCFQTAVLTMGAALWLTNKTFVGTCVEGGKWLILTGFLINGLSVGVVLLLAINRNIVRAIIVLSLKAGKALHLVKDLPRASSRADAALEDFRSSVDMITHHPMHLLLLLLLSYLQVTLLMSAAYCSYRALGLYEAKYTQLLTLQLLLFIAASFTPLPGASGAQEGGFYLFFGKVIPGDLLFAALLMWRFCTYYVTLLIGMCSVIYESMHTMRLNTRKAASPDTDESVLADKKEVPEASGGQANPNASKEET